MGSSACALLLLAYILCSLPGAASVVKSTCTTWHRKIAVSNAAGLTGVAALGLLRDLADSDDESYADLSCLALVRDEGEADGCRQALCGAVLCEGRVRDLCTRRFPSLRVSTAMGHGDGDALKAALTGTDALLVLTDEMHPTLLDSSGGEQICAAPATASLQTQRCVEESLRLIDAAAAAGVQHVILQSALGASDSGFSSLQTARMGGQECLLLRRRLEEHLESYSSTADVMPLRHTILQAAPYASPLQIAERRRRDLSLQTEDGALTIASPPLTSPESLANAAVKAALHTRPNALRRRITREVVAG